MKLGAVEFEQYKLAVEMADRVSQRRGAANSFFLSVESGLATLAGVFSSLAGGRGAVADLGIYVLGALTSVAWFVSLKSYRDLSRAKWSVICDMERSFPARPFSDEWGHLKTDRIKRWRGRYAELGTVERLMPLAFLAFYGALIAGVVAA